MLDFLRDLIIEILGKNAADRLLSSVSLAETAPGGNSAAALPRGALATALCLLLLQKLLDEVPEAVRYMSLVAREGRKLVLDHGALRTVRADWTGSLPSGQSAFTRILEPLGYTCVGLYPLDALRMTGRAYAHQDDPPGIPQFFVSEIRPEAFSKATQGAAESVFGGSRDPLDDNAKGALAQLAREGAISYDTAKSLLPGLAACFDRHHPPPAVTDYEALLRDSAEFAWIATEGNRFNHATDRVSNVEALVGKLRALQFPMKEAVEVSATGLVRQIAIRAAQVERPFRGPEGQIVTRLVPGSFFEFISRGRLEQGDPDLRFDTSNAQGIFKMTAASKV